MNACPLHPCKEIDPLKHLNTKDWKYPHNVKNEIDFEKEWEIENALYESTRNKILWIKNKKEPSKYHLIKVYKTRGNEKIFCKRYQEFVFIQQTLLMEYYNFYYNRNTKKIYIEMPFYGDTLKEIINENGPINDENKVKLIAFDLLDKLWTIHNTGYVHCDVKPSNTIQHTECKHKLDNNINTMTNGGYKLIDFELMHKNNSKGKYVGTMGWSAPEISPNSNKNVYHTSSDIFAFGLVILYLVCGKNPFEVSRDQRIIFINQLLMEDDKITTKQIKHKFNNIWYDKIISKSEYNIKNLLVRLYYNDKISLQLFELLFDGLLVYNPTQRWNCNQIYHCKWFDDIQKCHT